MHPAGSTWAWAAGAATSNAAASASAPIRRGVHHENLRVLALTGSRTRLPLKRASTLSLPARRVIRFFTVQEPLSRSSELSMTLPSRLVTSVIVPLLQPSVSETRSGSLSSAVIVLRRLRTVRS